MRGQNIVLQRRMVGESFTIFVDVLDHEPSTRGFLDLESYPDNREIWLGPREKLSTADLRCTHGALVIAQAPDDQTTRALCQRLMTFSPSEIIALVDEKVCRWVPGMSALEPIPTESNA